MDAQNKEKYEFMPLEWDTNYFGVSSSRIIIKNEIDENELRVLLEQCEQYQFVTITNLGNLNKNNFILGEKTCAFIADINIQFIKKVDIKATVEDQSTGVFNNLPSTKRILDISKSSFRFSRFFNDQNLNQEKARNVYKYWIECAFDKKDKYFVITTRNKEIAGFILFNINNKKICTIELIAVDEKYKGQRVGKLLVVYLESFLLQKKIDWIKVGTQINNISAIRFYLSCGFSIESCSSIYHYWPQNNNKEKYI